MAKMKVRVARFAARRWVALVLIVLVAVFIGQNRDRVSIDLFWAHLKAPLWFVLLLTAIVGAIIGWLVSRRKLTRAAGHRSAGHRDPAPDSPPRAE